MVVRPTPILKESGTMRHHLRQLTLIILFGCLAFAAGRFATRAAGADEAKRPNILLVIADDWSYGHAGAYGCRWIRTPAFDRVAREGALFSHAFTNNPKCSPCRASLLTGRNTWQL